MLNAIQKAEAIEWAYQGKTQSAIARDLGVAIKTIKKAAVDDLIFGQEYGRALDAGLDALVDQLIDNCDTEENLGLLRQRSDNIKWVAGKRGHQRYGDRLEVNLNQTIDLSGALIEARKRSPLLSARNHTLSPIIQDTEYTELIGISHTDNQPVSVQPAAPSDDLDIFA